MVEGSGPVKHPEHAHRVRRPAADVLVEGSGPSDNQSILVNLDVFQTPTSWLKAVISMHVLVGGSGLDERLS